MAARWLVIRGDVPATNLRGLARRERSRSAAARMYAVANALEGMTRAESARLAGLERQALRDAVVRYNAEGLAGFQDRLRPGPKSRLDAAEQATSAAMILAGPDVEGTGLSAWTLPDLCCEVETRWGKRFHPASLSRVVRKLGFSRQKARPSYPRVNLDAQAAFAKRGFAMHWTRSVQPIPASA